MRSESLYVGPKLEYQLLERLGGGGEGNVWAAVGTGAGQAHLAIKEYDLTRAGVSAASLERRAEELSMLTHPQLARVYRGFVGGRPQRLPEGHVPGRPAPTSEYDATTFYLVMERVGGVELSTWLETHPRAEFRERLALLEGPAAALDAMHRGQGRAGYGAPLQHNDVKPRNIHVDPTGERRTGVLLDFGLTRFEGQSLSRPMYTAAYFDPTGSNTPGERDVFAFLAATFETLLGTVPPLQANGRLPDVPAMCAAVESSTLLAQRPDARRHLINALTSAPGRRPTSLSEWLNDLAGATTVHTPTAHPGTRSLPTPEPRPTPRPAPTPGTRPAPTPRVRNGRRGRRTAVAAAAAVALVLLVASYASGQPAPLSGALHRLTGTADDTATTPGTSTTGTDAGQVVDSPSATPKKVKRSAAPPATPTVTWKLASAGVNKGEKWSFTYNATSVAGTSRRVELQRKNPDDGSWETVEDLIQASGSHSRGAPPLGRTPFRLVVTDPSKSGLLASTSPVTVTTYQTLTLDNILGNGGMDTVSVNGRLFRYAYEESDCARECGDDPYVPSVNEVTTIHANTCRSIHLAGVALRNEDSTSGLVAPVLSLQQVGRPELTLTFSQGQVETFDATIASPDWTLSWKAPNGVATDLYLDGTASCWSNDGTDPNS